jgi:tRNA(Ile)-lysidine synthase
MRFSIRKQVLAAVNRTIETYEMLRRVRKLVIAFSGGPDSVCLLDTLYALYKKHIDFHLVYVNHHLRPEKQLRKEETIVKYYADKYRIPYSVKHVTVTRKKTGLEAAAREKRYQALQECKAEADAQAIALGHNLDDVVETFFMNILRGSGIHGLTSIPAERIPYIRPLIHLRKDVIHAYVRNQRLRYSMDETNRLLDYRRNVIRQTIVPRLLKIYPELHGTIDREIALLRIDDSYLEELSARAFRKTARREANCVLLDISSLLKYNQSLINRVIMHSIKALRGNLEGFESKHFPAIAGLTKRESGKRIQLPKGLYARKEYQSVVISTRTPSTKTRIAIDCRNDIVEVACLKIRIRTLTKFNLKKKKVNCEVFDLDELTVPCVIRNRRTGDVVKTTIGRKRMKKIYNEYKIPVRKRDNLMMLCDRLGILWIFGIVRAQRAYVSGSTKNFLVVDYEHVD